MLGTALSLIATEKHLHMWQHPKGTDKQYPHSYLDEFYSRKLVGRRSLERILEIGIANGASLALWAYALPNCKVIGVDIQKINSPHPELLKISNVDTLVADAYSDSFLSILNEKFDLIIDDGPHTLSSQVRAVQLYSRRLNPNGMLVVEDIAHGLRTARKIRKSCNKSIRRNLVYYDYRDKSNHFDNCMVVYFESSSEAKDEKRGQPVWDRVAFSAPFRLPSRIAIKWRLKRLVHK